MTKTESAVTDRWGWGGGCTCLILLHPAAVPVPANPLPDTGRTWTPTYRRYRSRLTVIFMPLPVVLLSPTPVSLAPPRWPAARAQCVPAYRFCTAGTATPVVQTALVAVSCAIVIVLLLTPPSLNDRRAGPINRDGRTTRPLCRRRRSGARSRSPGPVRADNNGLGMRRTWPPPW